MYHLYKSSSTNVFFSYLVDIAWDKESWVRNGNRNDRFYSKKFWANDKHVNDSMQYNFNRNHRIRTTSRYSMTETQFSFSYETCNLRYFVVLLMNTGFSGTSSHVICKYKKLES